MMIRVTDSSLTIEATDQDIVSLGLAAADAVSDQVDQPGTIPGDLPAGAGLSAVWQALRTSLEDIRRRATAAKGAQEPAAGSEEPAATGEEAAGPGEAS